MSAVATALLVALMAGAGTGCGKADERALRQGREAEVLGDWQKAKECYARAAALDNAEGVWRLAELLVKGEGASLFKPSRKRDAEWIAEAEAFQTRIGDLVRTAKAKGAQVGALEGAVDSYANDIRLAKEAARLQAEAEAKRRAEETEAANALSQALAKAKRAEGDGLINFYGFYVGMPKEDAILLRKHYGLQDDECWLSMSGEVVGVLEFSLGGIRRLTKGGNSFQELAQAVANRIGDLQWSAGQHCYEYETINGNSARLYENGGLKIAGGAVLGPGRTPGETKTMILPGGAEMEMVWCPPGTFMMGSPGYEEDRDYDETQHQVTLTKGFWMAKYEVTQKQWKSVMEENPSEYERDNLPVDSVTWPECMEFCRKSGLRLPTEAEWEYACRAGSTGPYAGTGQLAEMGWYNTEWPHPVGQKKANAWGLHDMHGNVMEWCADVYAKYPDGAVTDPSTREAAGSSRVLRGGGRKFGAGYCRSANRFEYDHAPASRYNFIGFRPCCSAGVP